MKLIPIIGLFVIPRLISGQAAKMAPDSLDPAPAFAEVVRLNRCAGKYAESVFYCQTKEKRRLPLDSVKPFLKLVHNLKSYSQPTAACHDPGLGVILFNKSNKPVAYYSICLACNNVYAKPELKRNKDYLKTGFSQASRNKMRKLFSAWGFPYAGPSEMFDSKEVFKRLTSEPPGGK